MSTVIHFMNVGQGSMNLIEASDGSIHLFDCNLTDDREDDILDYLSSTIGEGTQINFICSHRDADHMRGIREVHRYFPIKTIRDSAYPGTTADSTEYKEYMTLRRQIGAMVVTRKTKRDLGRTRFRYMSAKDDRLPKNANAQGIVMKVEHLSSGGTRVLGSAMLTGDSDAETWRHAIMDDYDADDVSCDILVAGHHGSITFFDDPGDDKNYYTSHISAMSPDMTIVSVGDNSHGHPAPTALKLYRKYSSGSDKGTRLLRTDKHGNIRLTLKDAGGWSTKNNN